MVIDIVAITLLIVFFIKGYRKGIIVAICSIIALVLGIICALRLSERLATYLLEKEWVTTGWAQLISYIILFTGVVLLVRLIAKALENAINVVMLGWVNKGIGGILYGLMAAIAISAMLWLVDKMDALPKETIAQSKTYPYLSPIAPWVADKVGLFLPFAKNLFNDLQDFFTHVNEQLPQHVDTPR